MKNIIAKVITVAKSQVGVKEKPIGSNRGPEVEAYLRSCGLGGGYAWCAAFVAWVIQQATAALDVDNPWKNTAYCPSIEAFAKSRGIFYDSPEVGDVFLSYSSPEGWYRASHTGIVTRVDGNLFYTVEGNTNNTGSRVGDGVYSLSHTNTSKYRFVRLSQLLSDPETKVPLVYIGPGQVEKIADVEVVQGAAMLPIRLVAEKFGHTVGWDKQTGVTIDGKDPGLMLKVKDGLTFASARPLAEVLDLVVGWTGAQVTLATKG